MKVNNIDNLKKVIKDKEKEIEIYGDINHMVLKAGLVSNIIFFGVVLCCVAGAVAAISIAIWLITYIYALMAVGIVALCVVIFSLTLIFTIKASQKISVPLAFSLRKYKIEKKNNKIILIKK